MATLELDWTAGEVEALRRELIRLRNESLQPQQFDAVKIVVQSHAVIALAEFQTVLEMIEAAGDGAREMGAWKAYRAAVDKLLNKLRGRFPCSHYKLGMCSAIRGTVICADQELCQAVLEFAKAIE
jgi:hypothetical protein